MQQPYWTIGKDHGTGWEETTEFVVENAPEHVDEPGEFSYDRTNKVIYYVPRSGQDMNSAKVIANSVEILIQVKGASPSEQVQAIEFRGIAFHNSDYQLVEVDGSHGYTSPQTSYGFATHVSSGQAAFEFWRGHLHMQSALQMVHAESVRVVGCRFEYCGGAGVDAYNDVQNSTIVGNVLQWVAGSSVYVGDFEHGSRDDIFAQDLYPSPAEPQYWVPCKNVSVANNLVRKTTWDFTHSPVFMVAFTEECEFLHNDIGPCGFNSISMGLGWLHEANNGLDPSGTARNNRVGANRFNGAGWDRTECSFIYSLGHQPGTVVDSNYCFFSGTTVMGNRELADWDPVTEKPVSDAVAVGAVYPDSKSYGLTYTDNVYEGSECLVYTWWSGDATHTNTLDGGWYSSDGKGTCSSALTVVENAQPFDRLNPPPGCRQIMDNAGLESDWEHLLDELDWTPGMPISPRDTTPPTAPANLRSTDTAETHIDLEWNEALDKESGIDHYKIYRDGSEVDTTTATTFTDTGLNGATEYRYRVSAVNGDSVEGAQGNELAVSTEAGDHEPPTIDSIYSADDPTSVTVVFSESVETSSAESPGNYSISNGITVADASLSADLKTVMLTTSPFSEGVTYTITIDNVADLAPSPNTLSNVEATFRFDPVVTVTAAPEISPDGGDHADSVVVSVQCPDSGADIYYTLDNSRPGASSTKYSGPFTLRDTTTVKVVAFADSLDPSDIVSATFNVGAVETDTIRPKAANPTFDPNGAVFKDSVVVGIAASTADARIHFTMNNTDPDSGSALFDTAVVLKRTTTMKAIAFAPGHQPSDVVSATFVLDTSSHTTTSPAANPTISPNGGAFQDSVEVSLETTTSGAPLYYKTDGSAPDSTTRLYSGSLILRESVTLKVIACATGHTPSAVVSADFTITPTPREIAEGVYTVTTRELEWQPVGFSYEPEAPALTSMLSELGPYNSSLWRAAK